MRNHFLPHPRLRQSRSWTGFDAILRGTLAISAQKQYTCFFCGQISNFEPLDPSIFPSLRVLEPRLPRGDVAEHVQRCVVETIRTLAALQRRHVHFRSREGPMGAETNELSGPLLAVQPPREELQGAPYANSGLRRAAPERGVWCAYGFDAGATLPAG